MSIMEKCLRYILAGGLIGQMIVMPAVSPWSFYAVAAGVYLVTTALTGWDAFYALWHGARTRMVARPAVHSVDVRPTSGTVHVLHAANDEQEKVA